MKFYSELDQVKVEKFKRYLLQNSKTQTQTRQRCSEEKMDIRRLFELFNFPVSIYISV